MKFYKYHGTGNDFIMLDNRDRTIALTPDDIRRLCNRKYGIGADGLILLNPAADFDFAMSFHNNDGSTDTFCGNGGRCIAAFANRLGIIGEKGSFMASDGVHHAEIVATPTPNKTLVRISMSDCIMPQKLSDNTFYINTGAPHIVIFCDDIAPLNVPLLGAQYSNNPHISGRANVNFVEKTPDILRIRTFERGVEDETLSCGTGITAAALTYAAYFANFATPAAPATQSPITVVSCGGTLNVYHTQTADIFHNVFLEGDVTFVFEGEID